MGTSGGEAAARAAALPAPTLSGDMKLLGGERCFMGPIGYDVGTLVASLLLSWLGARGQVEVGRREVSKGGYAKFTAEAKVQRWSGLERDILATVEGFWEAWVAAFVASWRREWESVEASLERVDYSCIHLHGDSGSGEAQQGGKIPPEKWNATPTTPLINTQVAFLGGVLGDALGYAGAMLCARVFSSCASSASGVEELASLSKSSPPTASLAAAKAAVLGRVLMCVGQSMGKNASKAALAVVNATPAANSFKDGTDDAAAALEALYDAWKVVGVAAKAVEEHGAFKASTVAAEVGIFETMGQEIIEALSYVK